MESSATIKSETRRSESSTMLAPGFRFHPTDEELVRYYLRRKVCGKGFRFDAISDIDIYKAEPWDLPNFSKLKTRDLEWYFFSVLDKKYGNGSRTNRATERGYWKTTGKDRAVYHKSLIVGMKKTLVYHNGRAPKGLRTNWVMHEYRLTDVDLDKAGIPQDAFVLCRIFQKSGSGPKNGERYGAPFMEEEWENDEVDQVPKVEAADTFDFDADVYLDFHDLEEILESNASPFEDSTLVEETAGSLNAAEQRSELYQPDVLSPPSDAKAVVVKHEFIGESSKTADPEKMDFSSDDYFFDSTANLPYGNGEIIEGDNMPVPNVETNSSPLDLLDEYLAFFDANVDNTQEFGFDPSLAFGTPDFMAPDLNQMLLPPEEPKGVAEGEDDSTIPKLFDDDAAAYVSDKLDSSTHDLESPFVKRANRMLGSFDAPPAFASEPSFSSKDSLSLNLLSGASGSVRVTAGMIRISDGYDEASAKYDDHSKLNIVVSLGFCRGDDGSASLESSVRILPGKAVAAISRSWFYFTCLCIVLFSITIKLGMCVPSK
ncbi:nam-like protein 9 [Genlisea aurea]|uniref:Nam-like protein 9 n=1 Tax=Genlisea aurea TaxID=192259 RepID=S8DRF3_9LAMI|nr:nam-like protein 9 [Genlisea aurea]